MKRSQFAVLMLIIVMLGSVLYADPGADMKSSPLFKASLQKSIDRLDGKVEINLEGDTQKPGCIGPRSDPTRTSTCTPSVCSDPDDTCGETCSGVTSCGVTCGGVTCVSTCASTCQSTCSSTCANTCVPGTCANYRFIGRMYWYDNILYGTGNYWAFPGVENQLVNRHWGVSGGYGGDVYAQFGSGTTYKWIENWDLYDGDYDGTWRRTIYNGNWKVIGATWVAESTTSYPWFIDEETYYSNPPTQGINNIRKIYIPLYQ